MIQTEDPTYKGFTHRDCGVQWWKKFVHHGLRGIEETQDLDGALRRILAKDVSGPKTPPSFEGIEWDNTIQPGRNNNLDTPKSFAERFKEQEAMYMCRNFSPTTIQRAIHMFASVSNKGGIHATKIVDVGFLSQESHQDDSSILPSFPSNPDTLFMQSQELASIDDPFSDDEDNIEPFFASTINEQLQEGCSKDASQAFIDDLDRETRELKNLVRSSNYSDGMIDTSQILKSIREAQLVIKQKMQALSKASSDAEWVSCCPQRSKRTKRFHASKNC